MSSSVLAKATRSVQKIAATSRRVALPATSVTLQRGFQSSTALMQQQAQQKHDGEPKEEQTQRPQQSQQPKQVEVSRQQNQPSRRDRERSLSSWADMEDPFRAMDNMTKRMFGRDWTDMMNPMTMWNQTPFRAMDNLSRRMLKDIQWNPKADVITKEGGGFTIQAELPGVTRDNIKVRVEDDILTLEGEKKEEHVEGKKGTDFYRQERSYGSFMRQFTLPAGVDPKSIKSSFKDGVLKIEVPKGKEIETAHTVKVE